jgi:hypothetical protein
MRNKLKGLIIFVAVFSILLSITVVAKKRSYSQAINNLYEAALNIDVLNGGESIAVSSRRLFSKRGSLQFKAYDETLLQRMGYRYSTEKHSSERAFIHFGVPENYSLLKGVTTFRGNNFRDGGSYGRADIKEETLEIIWRKPIGAIDSWSGVGWNGQPAIVQWDKEVAAEMNIYEDKKLKVELKEVIYGAMDGNIYFLDLEDGRATRPHISIGAPIKGSVTIDPRGIPLLYVGQGINRNGSSFISFAYRIFSLIDSSKLYEIKGNDSFAPSSWGAFDSNALIDRYNDYLFICGENGLVYSGKLNTEYSNGRISVNPVIDKYRYDISGKKKKGIESSIAIYGNYGFFADNDGILQCIDLNTLSPVWALDVTDDTDSTVVLERESRGLSLYTACEVDWQGPGGYSYIRKVDAESGELLWENKYKCYYDKLINGGALATPVLGKYDLSQLVIFNIAHTPTHYAGLLIAFDKATGEEVWKQVLRNYCWSSPIAIYTRNGKGYIIQGDSQGAVMLIDGISGEILDIIQLGSNIEGTPAAFGNIIVVGTRGGEIIGFRVK